MKLISTLPHSQREIAELLGITQSAVAQIKNPTLATLFRICEVTGYELHITKSGDELKAEFVNPDAKQKK